MKARLLWSGLAAFLLVLVAVLPVRWILWALPSQLQCAAWSGSVWRGQCAGMTIQQAGTALQIDELHWDVHPAALLRLALRADFSFRNAQGSGNGTAELGLKGRMAVEDLAINAVFDRRIATMLAEGWKGQLESRQLTMKLQGSQLQALAGEISLRDFQDGRGTPFGSYRLEFPASGAPPFKGTLTDTSGPLGIAASVTIGADRSWQIEGLITPRPEAPAQLRSRLELLSAPNASGQYQLRSEGIFR